MSQDTFSVGIDLKFAVFLDHLRSLFWFLFKDPSRVPTITDLSNVVNSTTQLKLAWQVRVYSMISSYTLYGKIK